jgi:hypothetical protein
MKYENLVKDFVKRTKQNNEMLRKLQIENPNLEFYEVTQLINSLLGLLVFPQQEYLDDIPNTPLDELAKSGWPIPKVVGDYPQVEDLNQLVRYLRNSIAHFNIIFFDEFQQIAGLTVWNERKGEITWKATLTISDIEEITNRFVDLMLEENIK